MLCVRPCSQCWGYRSGHNTPLTSDNLHFRGGDSKKVSRCMKWFVSVRVRKGNREAEYGVLARRLGFRHVKGWSENAVLGSDI